MIIKIIIEGLILGLLLIFVCAAAKRKSAAELVYLYHKDVQERCVSLGHITYKRIHSNNILFKSLCIPGYIAYVLICVYAINGANEFFTGFLQLFAILSIMNLIDRFVIDEWWVGHTSAWDIPGTEDLKPYITARDKCAKWFFGTVGMAVIAAILAGIMTIFIP